MTSTDPVAPSRPVLSRLAATLLALLAFLPIGEWLHVKPWLPYDTQVAGWLERGALALALALALAIVTRRMPTVRIHAPLDRLAALYDASPVIGPACVAAVAFVAYAVASILVFDRHPLIIDELVQLIQARIFTTGRLVAPAPAHPEFTSLMHLVDTPTARYGQFPAGGPALLALGLLAHAEWLVVPFTGALAVLAWGLAVPWIDRRPAARLAATALMALAPFHLLQSGTFMNHVPGTAALLGAVAALFAVGHAPTPRPWAAALTGLLLGVAATIRPADALAFAAPAAIWLLWLAVRDARRWRDVAAAAAGLAVPVLLLAWVNVQTTGAPLRFGYTVLYGPSHDLGFHASPWGLPHTPRFGLANVNGYLLELQDMLFEAPIPSLLLPILGLALARDLRAGDRYLLASGGLVALLYFGYWHRGEYVGPRFFHPLVPLFCLWTVRAPTLIREALEPRELAQRTCGWLWAVSAVWMVAVGLPLRGMLLVADRESSSLRWDPRPVMRSAPGALILVREGWSGQLLARLWALGVSRRDAERYYTGVDVCLLEQAVSRLERAPRVPRGDLLSETPAPLRAALEPLMADSARVVPTTVSPDRTERMLPGTRYGPGCVARILDDRAGFLPYAPYSAAPPGATFVRDLHARDTLLLREYGTVRWYLLKAREKVGDPPTLFPVALDSARAAWAREAAGASAP